MKGKTKFYIALSVLAVLLAVIGVRRIILNSAESAKKNIPAASVITSKLQKHDMVRSQLYTGDIYPIQQASIYSKVSGNLEKVYVDIGQFVRQGQILALVDTTLYVQNMKQAYAAYLQADANQQNMKLNYDRNKSLLTQKLISQQDVDNSKAAFDIAHAQKEAALASYKNAQTQLSYCKITAPFSGFITKRNLDAGAYLTSSTSQASSVIFTLMDLDVVKIMANIPEKDIASLKSVLSVDVTIDALQGKVFPAQIKKMSQAVDMTTRTLAVELDINNKDHQLKPGMFANISLVLEKKNNILSLPIDAVIQDDNGQFVYVITPDSVAHKKYVETGIKQANLIEIVSGVSETDKIVTVGQTLLKDNGKVRLTK